MAVSIKGSWNDKATLPITCPECKHTTDELISKLIENKSCVCGGCGKTIAVTGNLLDELEGLKKIIGKLNNNSGAQSFIARKAPIASLLSSFRFSSTVSM